MEHKESCGFCDLLLLLAVFSLMLSFSHSFLPIMLSRAFFISLKGTAWDANIIYVFYKFFSIFCTNRKITKLLSSVADWDIAGVLQGMEIPVDPQSYQQHLFFMQTFIKQLLTWALLDQRTSHSL